MQLLQPQPTNLESHYEIPMKKEPLFWRYIQVPHSQMGIEVALLDEIEFLHISTKVGLNEVVLSEIFLIDFAIVNLHFHCFYLLHFVNMIISVVLQCSCSKDVSVQPHKLHFLEANQLLVSFRLMMDLFQIHLIKHFWLSSELIPSQLYLMHVVLCKIHKENC